MYADYAYYEQTYGGTAAEEDITPKLQAASDAIDVLTFSRINAIGWEKFTKFQQDKILRACCIQADFLFENADAVESAMTHYSINGVTMEFGNASLYQVIDGTAISNAAYSLLKLTGLASRFIYPPEVDAYEVDHALA